MSTNRLAGLPEKTDAATAAVVADVVLALSCTVTIGLYTVDATVVLTGKYGSSVISSDTERDSPYSSMIVEGLRKVRKTVRAGLVAFVKVRVRLKVWLTAISSTVEISG